MLTATAQSDLSSQTLSTIDPEKISEGALKVIAVLRENNFQAYLVGGGVRDLLLGRSPKDFDVATDATPEQSRELFRGSRIVGRRFRITHVRMGRETVEVTTFRGQHDDIDDDEIIERGERPERGATSARNNAGMLLRDNVYGTMEDDALRRDLTINALYYSPEDDTIHDFANGLDDLENRRIRVIGDPATRYREDPVRLLRVIRFAAKLGFDIEPATAEPIGKLSTLISNVSSARMFDEMLKLFLGGAALDTFNALLKHDMIEVLLPATCYALENSAEHDDDSDLALIRQGMVNTDERIAIDKPVTPAFLFAVLLWPAVRNAWRALMDGGEEEYPALQQAATEVLAEQQYITAIPRRFSQTIRDIWMLQDRLPRRKGKRAAELLVQRPFRAGYDFLLLREQAGEIEPGLGQWYTEYQEQNPDLKAPPPEPRSKRPQRRRRRPDDDNQSNERPDADAQPSSNANNPSNPEQPKPRNKKRRRPRRKKPTQTTGNQD